MKSIKIIVILLSFSFAVNAQKSSLKVPSFVIGNFKDDYGISYEITDTLWVQYPNTKYHIIKWNPDEQFLIAKNDERNKSDGNKYTRIDYMTFNGMEPFLWGFCLTAYKANTDKEAEDTAIADRKNPKKGCGGYPFSRMKRDEKRP